MEKASILLWFSLSKLRLLLLTIESGLAFSPCFSMQMVF